MREIVFSKCVQLCLSHTHASEKEHTDYTVRKHIEMGEKLKERMQRFGYTVTNYFLLNLDLHGLNAGSLGDACQSNESHQNSAGTVQSGRDT